VFCEIKFFILNFDLKFHEKYLLNYYNFNILIYKNLIILMNNETVLDMFAGFGYFSIPIAIHFNPKKSDSY
jgi:hypothetical protein